MMVDEKMAPMHAEEKAIEESVENDQRLDRIDTVDIDNYHGIDIKTVLVYVALCINYFIQLFEVVGVGSLSRNIGAAVGGSNQTVWLSQVVVIFTTVLGPPASQAADYFGRKWILVIGSVFGLVGALIFSRANTMGQAIGGQSVSSIQFMSQCLLTAVASEIWPRKYRPAAQGGLNAAGAAGAIAGLLIGPALTTDHLFGWRVYWYIVAGLLGISALLIVTLYNPPPRPLQKSLSTREKLSRLDWTGYFLLCIGLVLFTMGLSWGLNPYPWSSAYVLAPLLVGACFFVALIVHQTFFKKDGLLHHDLFKKDRNFAVALGCLFVDGIVFWAANSYFAFQVSVLYESKPILIGLHFCIAFFAGLAFVMVIPLLTKFTKRLREPIVVAFLNFTIFFALMATTKLSSAAAVWVYPIFLGWGLTWSLTYIVTAAQLSAPPHLIAISSGIILSGRSFGGSVGLAIFTAIFNSKISHLGSNIAAAVLPLGFPPSELPGFIGALAGNDQAALAKIPGVTPQIIGAGVHALQTSYLSSFRGVWIAAAVIAGATVFACCTIINPKNDLNNHVDAPLEE